MYKEHSLFLKNTNYNLLNKEATVATTTTTIMSNMKIQIASDILVDNRSHSSVDVLSQIDRNKVR